MTSSDNMTGCLGIRKESPEKQIQGYRIGDFFVGGLKLWGKQTMCPWCSSFASFQVDLI